MLDIRRDAPSAGSRTMTARELRTARAQYWQRQRLAIMQYNAWIGHEPLRPNRPSIPMMHSYYAPITIVVPVYVP